MKPTVAIVAQGAMGAGIGGRLVENGVHVITSLAGRSQASVDRARAAGMVAVSDRDVAQADYFLSIVPPADALATAEKMAALIAANNKKPIYVDCNATSPPTKRTIGETIAKAGSPFVDVAILGIPPKPGTEGPALIASGEKSGDFLSLKDFGLKIRAIEGPPGAATALKMSYAGITKGTTALASMMMLAATRAGVAGELHAELSRSHPQFITNFNRAIPDMFGKAYRFNGEMEEIADFVGEDPAARKVYDAFNEFYTRIAADHAGEKRETGALAAFLKTEKK
jgi:putative dehydrogenase